MGVFYVAYHMLTNRINTAVNTTNLVPQLKQNKRGSLRGNGQLCPSLPLISLMLLLLRGVRSVV